MIIIRNCRGNGLTFGNVFPVLGQVAMTRVLCRRFIRGDIDQEEWEFRRKEPMSTGGPLSLRPLLDQNWFKQGGASNLNLAIGFFYYTLPFMPLGSASALAPDDPLPTLDQLLSSARFFLRCNMIKQQAIKHITSPYFFEKSRAALSSRIISHMERAANWQKCSMGLGEDDDEKIFSAIEQTHVSPVMSHGGSSIGNVGSSPISNHKHKKN